MILQTISALSLVCLAFFLLQLESHSSAGSAPTVLPRRAIWRPTSSVSTASPLTTASTLTAASGAHTRHPRGPPDFLRVLRETVMHQEETRLAWHHSVVLDVVMATADTDSCYCFSITLKGLLWLRVLKKKLTTNLDVHSSVYLKSHSTYLSVAKKLPIIIKSIVMWTCSKGI